MNTTDLREILNLDTLVVSYPPLEYAISNWADVTTDPTSDRREDLLHDKKNAIIDFFEWIGKPVNEITPQ